MTHPIQIILLRQLAGYLSVPLFLVDPNGDLLFYNEPAETVLGRRFDETGRMPMEVWSSVFEPLDESGQPLAPESVALRVTLTTRRPAHQRMFIQGLDRVSRHIEVTSLPIVGLQGEFLGAVALFWEITN
jgi:PAS domain-containing protein